MAMDNHALKHFKIPEDKKALEGNFKAKCLHYYSQTVCTYFFKLYSQQTYYVFFFLIFCAPKVVLSWKWIKLKWTFLPYIDATIVF